MELMFFAMCRKNRAALEKLMVGGGDQMRGRQQHETLAFELDYYAVPSPSLAGYIPNRSFDISNRHKSDR